MIMLSRLFEVEVSKLIVISGQQSVLTWHPLSSYQEVEGLLQWIIGAVIAGTSR
jgi:hypothetical protein